MEEGGCCQELSSQDNEDPGPKRFVERGSREEAFR